MLIRVYGFSWSLPGVVSAQQFYRHFTSINRLPQKFFGYQRLCFSKVSEGRFVGALLTIKDHRRFPTIDGDLKVTVEEIRAGTQMFDFNFFAVSRHANNNTVSGLYSTYKGAISIGKFNEYSQLQYEAMKAKLIEKESGHGTRHLTDDERQNLKTTVLRKYANSLGTRQLIREEDWPTLLEQLGRVSSFTFDASVLTNRQPTFRISPTAINSQQMKISFSADAEQSSLKTQLLELIGLNSIRSGKIEGKDHNNRDESVDLEVTPSIYSVHKYDEVLKEDGGIFLNYEHIERSPFLVTMLQDLESKPEFGVL